jgi:Ribonuclease G/E
MDLNEKYVKVKMSICPECGSVVRVATEHRMTDETKKEFMKEVTKYNLDIKTVSLEEYKTSNIEMFCKDDCPTKNKKEK